MTVEQITKVRKNLMKSQGSYRVVKNASPRIALNQLDHKGCDAHLKGPTGIALVKGDTTKSLPRSCLLRG
jgi:ribosomal protein L10